MADEKQQPIGGEAEEAASAVEARFTQEDINRIAAKERRAAQAAQKQLEDLQSKLAAIENEKKSEHEKALEAAAAKTAKERDEYWSSQIKQSVLDSELRMQLVAAGLDPDLAHVVKAKHEIATIDDIAPALDELKKKEWIKPKGIVPAQTGTPGGMAQSGFSADMASQRVASGGMVSAQVWESIGDQLKRGQF
jgi:hypothetical protein